MYTSLRILGAGVSALCLYAAIAGISAGTSQALIIDPQAQIPVVRVADTTLGTGGIQTWIRLTELDGLGEAEMPAQTLFVPSDAAFESLPPEDLAALLDRPDKRRAFLAGSATRTRISPDQLAGRRISVTTLDGRPLVIDGTGGELMVGDAEALDVRTLPDGRVVFVLDHAISKDGGRNASIDAED
jgi:hypothetical protein